MRRLSTELAGEHGIDPDSLDGKILARTLLRGIVEFSDDQIRRRRGIYPSLPPAPAPVVRTPDPVAPAIAEEASLPAPAEAVKVRPPALPFSQIYSRYEKTMRCPAEGEKPRKEQTIRQYAATSRLWLEFHGDRPLSDYTRDDAEYFKSALRHLPNLHGKSRDWRMRMREAVETVKSMRDAGQTPPRCLSTKTMKRHMSALSSFFEWVLEEKVTYGFRGENIFRKHRYGSVKSEREMWEEDDLNALFRTPIWTGCTPNQRAKTGSVIIYDAHYWMPLIAVFHGLRQEEIAQLRACDVRQDDGVWVLDIHDEDGNQLKNATAVRTVPIHDQLIALGFLGYADLFRGRGDGHLWPTLKRGGPDKKFSHTYRQRFTAYCRNTGIYDPKRPFHALRATFRTFLEETDAKSAHISKLAGHKLTMVLGEGATYTKRIKSSVLKSAINKFKPDVDLSQLRRFNPKTDRYT